MFQDKIDFYYSGDHQSGTVITRDVWHHIVVINNGGNLSFYLDGVADGLNVRGDAPSFNADNMPPKRDSRSSCV